MEYHVHFAVKMQQSRLNLELVKTGWTGGRHGICIRMKVSLTRGIIDAIHSGQIGTFRTIPDTVFGIGVVTEQSRGPAGSASSE